MLIYTKISQNHYFVQFRSTGSWGKEVKTAQKLDFQGFFADRVVVPTTRYSVSFAPLCETSPEQNTEKIELLFLFLGACALFSKFALRFCKNVFEKVFYGGKRYYCAFVRCGVWGSKPHPFVISGRRPRCLLIDRLDYFLDYSLDYSLDYGYQKSKCLCGFSDFHNIDFFTSQHRLFHFTT